MYRQRQSPWLTSWEIQSHFDDGQNNHGVWEDASGQSGLYGVPLLFNVPQRIPARKPIYVCLWEMQAN